MVGCCSWGEVNICDYCSAICQAPVVWRVWETRGRQVLVGFLLRWVRQDTVFDVKFSIA